VIFVDTGAFLARYLKNDQHHESSTRYWQIMASERAQCCTSTYVIAETLTLLSRRVNSTFAAAKGRAFYASQALHIFRSDPSTEVEALQILEKFADQDVSFTDCLSLALMRRHGISRVFSFDYHFTLFGCERLPE
jgi:predicted nucleic acid-binding protein